ncbi:MAG: phycobilisome rod-core linker polypeptide [Cyanobacteria bacterium J06638_22]
MYNFGPITVSRRSTAEERQIALNQMYRQVLERIPLESERDSLAKLEKDFLKDKIGVRRFLKELGCSDLYLKFFYYSSSNVKFLETCFKHFLGRAIISHEELRHYDRILTQMGVRDMIRAIMDSEEYRKSFGCFTVPYPRQLNRYTSPRAYLESQLVNEEHVGQRGWTMPALYWHQLGYTCVDGVCHHPEAHEDLEPPRPSVVNESPTPGSDAPLDAPTPEASVDELITLLRTASPAKAREMVAGLTPQQRQIIRKAIH